MNIQVEAILFTVQGGHGKEYFFTWPGACARATELGLKPKDVDICDVFFMRPQGSNEGAYYSIEDGRRLTVTFGTGTPEAIKEATSIFGGL